MRSRGRGACAVLSIIAIAFLVGITSLAFAGNNPNAKVAIHVRPHNAKLGCNVGTIDTCTHVVTQEPGFSVDAFPVFYDLTEYKGFEYGITWPAWTYSAAFVSCSDLVIGAVDWPGSGAAHAWQECQTGVGIPSFIWLYADAPGQICPTEHPAVSEIRVLDCAEGLDQPCGVFCAGVYGAEGDDPCTPCEVTFDPLEIVKYDDADVCVDPGGTVSYTIRYTNPNTSAVNNIVLMDTLPPEVNFVSATAEGIESAGIVTWNFTTLAGEAFDSVLVVVEVDTGTAYGITLVNVVGIVSDETDLANIQHMTTVCDFVYQPLNLSKSDDVATCAFPGDQMVYNLVYENPNEFGVTDVFLTDELPNNVDHVSSPGGFYDGRTHSVAWDLGTLAAFAMNSAQITVTVKAEAPQGSFVNNTCYIDGLETGRTNENLLTSICACLIEGPTEVCPGSIDQFSGPVDMASWAWSISGDGSIPGAQDGQTVDVTAHVTCPGSYQIELTVVDGGMPSTCTYTVTVNDTQDPVLVSCAPPVTVECWSDVLAPDTSLVVATDNCGTVIKSFVDDQWDTNTCPALITRTYKIEDNCGNFITCTQDITVDDTTPPTVDTCPGDITVECASLVPAPDINLVTGTDNCVGTDVIVTHVGDTTDGGACPEIITREYEVADSCGNADICTQYITIDDTTAPVITFCPPGERVPCNDPINFGTPTADDNCDGAITPTIILDESFAGPEAGEVTHRRGWEMMDACGNADTCYQEIIEGACTYVPLTLSKVDNIGSGCVERGAYITYTMLYENTNGLEVTNVVLSDEMPSGVSYVSSTPPGSVSGSTVDWNLGTLAASATGSVELVIQVDTGTSPGITLTNNCMITSTETGDTPASETTTICSATYDPLTLGKSDDIAACVERGANITYTINYENPNGDPVTNVILTDTLAPDVVFVSATGGGNESAGVVTWNIGALAGLGGGSVELVVQVDAGTTPGITLTNNCSITSDETGGTPASETTDVCACVIDGPPVVCPNSLNDYTGPAAMDSYVWSILGDGAIDGDNTLETVSVLAEDVCGGSYDLGLDVVDGGVPSTCYYTVSVEDNEDPAITCPADGGVACGDPVVFGTPTATDNCADPVTINETSTTTIAGPGPGEFTHERCWEALDDCNNWVTCCQVIIEEACTQLSITKSDGLNSEPGLCVDPGGDINYAIDYHNPNAVEIPNVMIVDYLPAAVDFVSATGGGVYDGFDHKVAWDIGLLPPSTGGSLGLVVTVDAGAMPGITLVNNVAASGDHTSPSEDDEDTDVCGTGVLPLDVDIKPGGCPNPFNTKSMGKLPVAILGTEFFDVYDIDPATVMLEGVPLLKYSYEDVATPVADGEPCECNEAGSDGYMDMVVHFNRQALVAALGPVTDGDMMELILMATKYDGAVLQGSDCVWIKYKPSNGQAAPEVVVVPDGGSTHILLSTEEAADITLVIYDVHGRTVARLLDEYKTAGAFEVIWDGKSNGVSVPAGVYFATASNPQASATKKFVVVK